MTTPEPAFTPISSHEELARFVPANCVVKLGSAVLTTDIGTLDQQVLENVADFASQRLQRGLTTMIVSSGAVAAGIGEMGLSERPRRLPKQQALAAVGQSRLMAAWRQAFARHDRKVAQILVSAEDFRDRRRYLNMRYTFESLFQMGIIPVINENDTITVEELRFGENDGLAQLVAIKMLAQMLILLTNVGGVYEKLPDNNQSAQPIPVIHRVDDALIEKMAPTRSQQGSGGMQTKLLAAREAARAGIHTIIGPGKDPEVFRRIFAGQGGCTLIPGRRGKLFPRRKRFIAFSRLKPRGRLWLDPGAVRAITTGKKSLLPAGVTRSEGEYARGFVLDLLAPDGNIVARGLTSYNSEEVQKILGHHSSEIEKILGHRDYDEIIHRDNLVVLETEDR